MRCSLLIPLLVVQVTDSDSDKFSDGEYLDDDIEKGNAVMAAVTVVVIFLIFFLCMAIMLTWTLLVLGDHQVMKRSPEKFVFSSKPPKCSGPEDFLSTLL